MAGHPLLLTPRAPNPEAVQRREDWLMPDRRPSELDLRDLELVRCDLAGVLAPQVRWQRCVLTGCRLTGAILSAATLEDVRFVDCQLDLVTLRESRLRRVSFENCVLREAELEQVTMDHTRFERCDLGRASFARASCVRVELVGCELRELASLDGLRGASLPIEDLFELAPLMARTLGLEPLER